ncbi:hypothetical protein BD324DRAFT_680636 [Kockovaella imperatae]|uniref:Uncharacterized protein n=1 Tax=Kockovaella imperatae TaxID=4999 RepID=A0A1Y1UID5_9TREE|nr:hypothetical protein BD324DRAFT_680636 [Kockovaella imperatae]ORX37749.1 hypothetical protein BD324DRAFT_680636 [Kockovaella imperatae]
MSLPASQEAGRAGRAARRAREEPQAKFSMEDDRVIGEMLVEERSRGAQGGFKRQTWTRIAQELNDRFHPDVPKTARSCQDHFSYVKNSYLIVAEDDIWDKYLAAHPKARKWRRDRWELYLLYKEATGNFRARGQHVYRPGDTQEGSDGEDDGGVDEDQYDSAMENTINELTGTQPLSQAAQDVVDIFSQLSGTPDPSRSLRTPPPLNGRRKASDALGDGLRELAGSIRHWAESSSNRERQLMAIRVEALKKLQKYEELSVVKKGRVMMKLSTDMEACKSLLSFEEAQVDPEAVLVILRGWSELQGSR